MFLYGYKCNSCKSNLEDSLKIDDFNITWSQECSHFKIYCSIGVNNSRFEKFLIKIKCQNCETEYHNILNEIKKNIKSKCDYCQNEITYFYILSDERENYYVTPEKLPKEEKINIILFYKFVPYSRAVNPKAKINKYYNQFRQDIKFNDKAIFLNNNDIIDLEKTFYENKLKEGDKIEIFE